MREIKFRTRDEEQRYMQAWKEKLLQDIGNTGIADPDYIYVQYTGKRGESYDTLNMIGIVGKTLGSLETTFIKTC